MASGWASDDAVQEQIDSTIDDAVARARSELPKGESLAHCEECGRASRRQGEKRFRACGCALNASRWKTPTGQRFQAITAAALKTASYAN